MSQQLHITSVAKEGESESEFSQYLQSKDVSADTISKLTLKKLNTFDLLRSIGDDLNAVADACGIDIIQKVKLRSVIQGLSPVIVDKEETMAVLAMEKKLKMLQASIHIAAVTQKKVDDQVTEYSSQIAATFEHLHEALNRRQTEIMGTLQAIAGEKKQKLQQLSEAIRQQANEAQQKTNLCRKRLQKSIDLNQIETRKKGILKIADEVAALKVITQDDAAIANNEIVLMLDAAVLSPSISEFGTVSASAVPEIEILSLEATPSCGIKVKWKLSFKPPSQIKLKDQKIQIEWIEAKDAADIDEKNEEDAKWSRQEFEVRNSQDLEIQEHIVDQIQMKSDVETIVVRMKYTHSNCNDWSPYSNSRSVKITCGYEKRMPSSMVKGPILPSVLFETVLPDALKSKQFTLLLRASQHGFDLQAFKDRGCFNKQSLLMVVTTKEYDRVFGGYTSTGWKENASYQHDNNAFMYFLSETQNIGYRFPVKNAAYALYHNGSESPRFGGSDLRLGGHCSRHVFDYSALGNDQTPLSGGPNGWKVKDCEIWQLR